MGSDPPFLYDPPSTNNSPYRAYNPKAVSQASFQVPTPKPKHEGPLVDFNKHPDSYLILPYGNINVKPMSSRTRARVKYTRGILLLLRCVELFAAIGLLVCVICVREIEEIMGWTLRIPPGIAIIHSLYAIYHLSRDSSRRTPGSSSSYMLFSAAADTSLLPFYVFTALMSHAQYAKHDGMKWKSVFDDPAADAKLVRAVFFLAVINGGLHLMSLCVSLYLAVIFNKISKLPPDMNPLEDNLTSRHKRNKSSINEKRSSQATSASSVDEPGDFKRNSQAHEPLIPPPRTVPFMHTRTESTASFNARPGNRNSRANLPSQIYQDESRRSSRVEITRSPGVMHPPSKRSSTYDDVEQTPPKRSSRNSLINDNWYTYFNHANPTTDENLARATSTVSSMKDYEVRLAQSNNNENDYHPLEQVDLSNDGDLSLPPNPLEAHPPTPPPALQPGSPNRAGSLKAKLYGDLKPATPPIMIGTYVDLPPAGTTNGRGGRVVSNSGTEYGPPPTTTEKRKVSGKIAEEGRGGAWARFRKVSGR